MAQRRTARRSGGRPPAGSASAAVFAGVGGSDLDLSNTQRTPTSGSNPASRSGVRRTSSEGNLDPVAGIMSRSTSASGMAATSKKVYRPIRTPSSVSGPVPVPSSAPESMKIAGDRRSPRSPTTAFGDTSDMPPVPRSRLDYSFGDPRTPGTPQTLPSVGPPGSRAGDGAGGFGPGGTGLTSMTGGRASSALGGGGEDGPLPPPSERGLAASASYAIQSHGNMWHYVGRMEPHNERPARRKEILDLLSTYDHAMKHADKLMSAALHGAETGGRSDPLLDQDFMNMRGLAEDLVLEMAPPEPEGELGSFAARESKHKLFTRGSEVVWRLATMLFQQKWSDLVTADTEKQVAVTCLEHGRLLARLRAGHAQVFGGARDLTAFLLQKLSDTTAELDKTKAALDEARSEIDATEERMEGRFQERLHQVAADITDERDKARLDAKAARDDASRMGDTLRTLNGIFKQLRDDTDAMRDQDLRDVCTRLEAKLVERERDLRDMTALSKEAEELRDANAEAVESIEKLTKELEKTRAELADRSALVQQVMQRESERLTEMELMATSVAMAGGTGGGGGGGGTGRRGSSSSVLSALNETKDAGDGDAKSEGSESAVAAYAYGDTGRTRAAVPDSVLCVRCHAALDDLAALDDSDDEETKLAKAMAGKHPPCMYYRIMLPVVNGPRPTRPAAWVRWCMRGIIMAKERADSMAVSEGRSRPRMPEFVYAWFAPTQVQIARTDDRGSGGVVGVGDDGGTSPSAAAAAAAKQAAAAGSAGLGGKTAAPIMEGLVTSQEADESRWAFYYGVRALARDEAEAKLFHNFLDEKYGEDEITFYLHCLRTLQEATNMDLKWGPTPMSCGYAAIPPRLHASGPRVGGEEKTEASRPGSRASSVRMSRSKVPPKPVPFVPDMVWIGLTDALNVANTVMGRASEEDKKTTMWRIKGKAMPAAGRLYGDPSMAVVDKNSAASELEGLGGEEEVVEELVNSDRGAEVGQIGRQTQCVDLALLMRMLLIEYREEQAHRRAALRLMFDTAVATIEEQRRVEAEKKAKEEGRDPSKPEHNPFSKRKPKELNIGFGPGAFKGISIDFKQFKTILQTVHSAVPARWMCALYRDAYEAGKGGVTFDSFAIAAQRHQFFSSCLRLPSHMGVSRSGKLTAYQEAQLAFVVDKHFRTFDLDLLPYISNHLVEDHVVKINSLLTTLRAELSEDGATLKRDGRRALVAYRRLLDFLLWVRQQNRELSGEDGDQRVVIRAETELTNLEAVLRADTAAMGPTEEQQRTMVEVYRGAVLSDEQWVSGDHDIASDGGSAAGGSAASGTGAGSAGAAAVAGASNMAKVPGMATALFKGTKKHGEAGTAFEILRRVNLLVNAIKIQRVFRVRQRVDDGVPWRMRPLMRVGYLARSGAVGAERLTGASPHSTKPKPLPWLLHSIAQIYLEKVHANAADDRENQSHQSLVTFLYDYSLTKSGVRDLAERSLHELFVATRAHMATNPRVKLFALFCGLRIHRGVASTAAEMLLELDEALEYYLSLLRRVQGKQKRKGKRRLSVNYLFHTMDPDADLGPPPSGDTVVPALVDKDATVAVVTEAMMHLSDTAAMATKRIEAMATTDGMLDLDEVLLVCMEEWAVERQRRAETLESLFRVGDLNLDMVLSLDEFLPIIKHAAPTKADKDIVRMFREASTLTAEQAKKDRAKMRAVQRHEAAVAGAGAAAAAAADSEPKLTRQGTAAYLDNAQEKEVDLNAFLTIARRYGLMSIKIEKAPPVPPGSDKNAQLMILQEEWRPFEHVINDTVRTAKLDAAVSTKVLAERLSVLNRCFVECDKAVTLKAVQQAWLAFRMLMSEWNKYNAAVAATKRQEEAMMAEIAATTEEGIAGMDAEQVRTFEEEVVTTSAEADAATIVEKGKAKKRAAAREAEMQEIEAKFEKDAAES